MMEEYYIIAGYNISFLYLVLFFVLIKLITHFFTKLVTNKVEDLIKQNVILSKRMAQLALTGGVELYRTQQKLYSNLFKLIIIASVKYGLVLLVFHLASYVPFEISLPFNSPLLLNIATFEFVSSLNLQLSIVSIILYMLVFGIALNTFKHIIYYTKEQSKKEEVENEHWEYNERDETEYRNN
jgi:hypothetical protein